MSINVTLQSSVPKKVGLGQRRIHLVRPLGFVVKVLEDLCKGCQLCVNVCPRHLLKLSNHTNAKGYLVVEWHNSKTAGCIGCGLCYEICPEQALRIYAEVEQ